MCLNIIMINVLNIQDIYERITLTTRCAFRFFVVLSGFFGFSRFFLFPFGFLFPKFLWFTAIVTWAALGLTIGNGLRAIGSVPKSVIGYPYTITVSTLIYGFKIMDASFGVFACFVSCSACLHFILYYIKS